ncbi:MAG TPA: phosphate ABC transporter substrate-binding protein PstS [Nitrososphaeraceae archaeon]|nr:phosphate ABC transporter substrate-binding protein PstS [Nitrososphaeraceae archaeon]
MRYELVHVFSDMFMDNQIRKPILLIVLIAGIFLAAIMPTIISLKAYAQGQITINGAGATFPFPLIDTWRVDYKNIKPNVNINYQSIGSGGGVKQFIEKTVDFGATDAPLTASEVQRAPGAVHIPETIGSVVAAYNIPSMPNRGLKLTGPLLADIFLGKITKWNDPKIQSLNPGVSLPGEDIIVVHRSDGSGTTYVWTDYLSNISAAWKEQIGRGKSVQWPIGIGGPGNEGVANAITGSPNTIGYVELAYALTSQMPYAYLQNQAGKFVEPTLESTRAAVAATAPTLPKGDDSWEHVSVVNAPGAGSYPVASFSYLILFKELSTNPSIDQAKAKGLVDFMSWAITDGQQSADDLSYVPLPAEVVKLNQETLKSLTFQGKPLTTSVGAQP